MAETVSLECSFLPGTALIPMDYYCGALIPSASGPLFASVVPGMGAGLQVTFGPAPVPLATNAVQIDPLTISVTHTWNGMESGGTYFIGAATTSPGADPLGLGDQASLDRGAVEVHGHFRPFGARPFRSGQGKGHRDQLIVGVDAGDVRRVARGTAQTSSVRPALLPTEGFHA